MYILVLELRYQFIFFELPVNFELWSQLLNFRLEMISSLLIQLKMEFKMWETNLFNNNSHRQAKIDKRERFGEISGLGKLEVCFVRGFLDKSLVDRFMLISRFFILNLNFC